MKCHFNNIIIKYPGQILVPENKEIEFFFNGDLIIFKLLRHFKPITIIDLSSEISKEKDSKTYTYQINENSEILNSEGFTFVKNENINSLNYIYNFHYSEIQFRYSCDIHVYKDKVDKIMSILFFFIDSYRKSSGDYTVQLPNFNHRKNIIINEYQRKYVEDEFNLSEKNRLNSIRNYGLKKENPKVITFSEFLNNFNHDSIDKNKTYNELANFFKSKVEPQFQYDILLKAHEEYTLNQNYKYALLDSFIFIESIISKYVENQYLSKKISKNKIEDNKTTVGIGYKLNILLPILFNGFSKKEKLVFDKANNIRKIRNDIVHQGISVKEKEAKNAIRTAYEVMEIINEKST